MTDSDNYYRRRIEEELEAARHASHASISRIHREMAELYREKLGSRPHSAANASARGPNGAQLADSGLYSA